MGPIPDECTFVIRLNADLPYSKTNCVWGRQKIGAREKKNGGVRRQQKKKEKKNPHIMIQIQIDENFLAFLKKKAIQLSIQQKRRQNSHDIIRSVLFEKFKSEYEIESSDKNIVA